MAGLTVESRRDGTLGVVRMRGEARLEELAPLRAQTRALLSGGVHRVLFDVGALAFADSASVGVLLDVQREAEAAGGGVAVFGATKRLARMLEGMGLAARLRLVADEAAARAAVGTGGDRR